METRPKIKLTLSKFDNLLELAGVIFLISMWGLTAYVFLKSPTTIPIHFGPSGEPDNYGNKATLFILPVIATLMYVGLTYLNRYPNIFNYMVEITEENAQKQYTIGTRTLRFIKLAIMFVITLIILFTYLTTIGVTKGLGWWFLPLMFVLFIVPVIVMVNQSLKKKNKVA